MASVILAGTDGIELFIVELAEPFPAIGVFPDPVCKCLFDQLLLALGDGRFLCSERDAVAMLVLHNRNGHHADSGFPDDLIAVDAIGAIGAVGINIAPVVGLAFHIPLAGVFGEMDFDVPLA